MMSANKLLSFSPTEENADALISLFSTEEELSQPLAALHSSVPSLENLKAPLP